MCCAVHCAASVPLLTTLASLCVTLLLFLARALSVHSDASLHVPVPPFKLRCVASLCCDGLPFDLLCCGFASSVPLAPSCLPLLSSAYMCFSFLFIALLLFPCLPSASVYFPVFPFALLCFALFPFALFSFVCLSCGLFVSTCHYFAPLLRALCRCASISCNCLSYLLLCFVVLCFVSLSFMLPPCDVLSSALPGSVPLRLASRCWYFTSLLFCFSRSCVSLCLALRCFPWR